MNTCYGEVSMWLDFGNIWPWPLIFDLRANTDGSWQVCVAPAHSLFYSGFEKRLTNTQMQKIVFLRFLLFLLRFFKIFYRFFVSSVFYINKLALFIRL